MRLVAAIIVAGLSVTTAGPLRCPCQLAALIQKNACDTKIPHPASPTDEMHDDVAQLCPCKARQTPQQSQPAEQPIPGVPCQHCPNVDLVPLITAGERLISDRDLSGLPALSLATATAVSRAHRPDTLILVVPRLLSSPPDPLRYCHSFRC